MPGEPVPELLRYTVTARKAQPVTLAPSATLGDVVLTVTQECADHWRANVDGVLDERAPECLHQLRVGVRRFRSSLALLSKALDDPQVAWLAAEIREVALPFGEGRDLDVVLAESNDALPWVARNALQDRRDRAYDDIESIIRGERWDQVWALVDRFRLNVRGGALMGIPARPATDDALEKRWRRVIQRGSQLRSLSPVDRHRVRIEAKKLRYGAQFFAGLHPETSDLGPLEFADLVAELQGSLGELNDAHTRSLILHSVGCPAPPFDETSVVEASVAIHARLSAVTPFWKTPTP